MPGCASGNSIPKRLESVVLVTPRPTKPEDFPLASGHMFPGECPRWCWDGGHLPRGNTHYFLSHRRDTRTLQWHPSLRHSPSLEEASKALGEFLSIKSSIDTCWHKLVWELSMDLHQKDSETAEFIKEAKAIHACSIQEAKTLCSAAVREAEAQGASQAGSLQQAHAKAV